MPFLTKTIKEQWLDPLLTLGTTIQSNNSSKDPINEGDFWFDADGVPLKWHYPVGLLYDVHANAIKTAKKMMKAIDTGEKREAGNDQLHHHHHTRVGDADGEFKDTVSIPWHITLHLRKFPADQLIRSPSNQTMRDMYMSMVKEADYLRFGSTKRVMDLSKADQTQLLDGLESHSFEQYHAIHTLLSSGSGGDNVNGGLPRHIPVRWHIFPKGSFQSDHATILQDLVSPIHVTAVTESSKTKTPPNQLSSGSSRPSNGAWVTLGDAFKLVYPDGFVESPNSEVKTPNLDQWQCWSQGIQPPWNTPLVWMTSNLAYPDGFLHLVLVESR